MNNQMRCTSRLHMPTVMACAVFALAGLVVGIPSVAHATATPTLSVSPSSGPIGSVVTVQFGPAGNGCGGPVFEPASGFSAGTQTLPAIGDHGSEEFVIPRLLSTSSAHTNAPVAPGNYQFVLVCDASNMQSTEITLSVPFTVTNPMPSRFVGMANTVDGKGYWLAQAGGGVFSYGDAAFYGSLPSERMVPNAQIVGIAASPDGKGYTLVGADGGVFSFGDARFFGSLADQPQDQPTVGIAFTPDGDGYWEVKSDGGVFSFGDAHFFGSSGHPFNLPTVGIASTPDGNGYWEVESDGGVFSYGDAQFCGSMGGQPLNRPVVGMSLDPITGGYWEVAADGGVFAFSPPFLGSTGKIHLNQPITEMVGTSTGRGYRLAAADGGVFDFGDAQYYGSPA